MRSETNNVHVSIENNVTNVIHFSYNSSYDVYADPATLQHVCNVRVFVSVFVLLRRIKHRMCSHVKIVP